MALSPQLPGTDFAQLDGASDRGEREQLYADNAIAEHDEPQGMRYTKGTDPLSTKRSWQSLDVILRSDASSAAALPKRSLRLSRLFTALTIACGILTVAGVAASAREGLDLQDINGTGGVLLAGGIATVGFGITAGVFYGRTKKGYQKAVGLYNDSLAVRLGINTAEGAYIPPQGVLVDEEGFVVLDERERAAIPDGEDASPDRPLATEPVGPKPAPPEPGSAPVAETPAPSAPDPAAPEATTPAPPAASSPAPPPTAVQPVPAPAPEPAPAVPPAPAQPTERAPKPAVIPAPPRAPKSAPSGASPGTKVGLARAPGPALPLLPAR